MRQVIVCYTCPTSAQTAGPLSSRAATARPQASEQSSPRWGCAWLCVRRCGLSLDWRPWPDALGLPCAGCPQEALAQEIKMCAAKHLPLQHFEAVNVALDRPGTPGQRDPSFDRLIVCI